MNMPKVSLAKLEEMIVEQEKERQNKLWRLDEIFRGFFSSSEELIDSFCYLAWKAKHCDIDIRDDGLDVFENEDELSRIALYKIRSISRDELAHIIPSVFGILLTSSDEDLTFYCTHAYQDSLSSSGPPFGPGSNHGSYLSDPEPHSKRHDLRPWIRIRRFPGLCRPVLPRPFWKKALCLRSRN
jgi:hypothetical protein